MFRAMQGLGGGLMFLSAAFITGPVPASGRGKCMGQMGQMGGTSLTTSPGSGLCASTSLWVSPSCHRLVHLGLALQ